MRSVIDEYIASFNNEKTQALLKQMREVIKESAPEAVETIKYQMPTFVLHGNLVHFAAFKNHLGFYPSPSGITSFSKELAGYKTSKGAIQFPYDKKLPLKLISKIVKYRAIENLAKWQARQR